MTVSETPVRPARLPLPPAIPITEALQELASKPRWVLWRYEWIADKEKWTKVPYRAAGRKASSTDPATWLSYSDALKAAEVGDFDGVGYVVYRGSKVEADTIVGIDIDHCIDPETNQLTAEADAMVDELGSYTETTPSGTGLRVFVRATLDVEGAKRGNVEVYQSGRYLTITGLHLPWTPTDIRDRQEVIEAFHRRVIGERKPTLPVAVARPVGLTDDELLRLMFASNGGGELQSLYRGQDGAYGPSEADLRLCGALAFWTGRDGARMDRLFRGSNRTRQKWDDSHRGDHATYGQMTIERAIDGCEDVYEAVTHVMSSAVNGSRPEMPSEIAETPSRPDPRPWPAPMDAAAFSGLAGETVRALQPFTEADPHGLLVSALTVFGCMLNSGPHLLHGSTTHWPRLFSLVVGGTGDGRKGESWSPIRRLIIEAEGDFRGRIQGGLSSGEGLIGAVRDATYGVQKGEVVLTDEGVEDKRLLVFEAEFARVLAVLGRETNTLGAIVRDAWDTGDLTVMTKMPTNVKGAHICIIGHVSPEELVANCEQSWITNGFLNRFLLVMVRRSQLLPIPRALDGDALRDLAWRWRSALDVARRTGRLYWSDEGKEWWEQSYSGFLTTETGKLGAMKVRAAPIILRLAMTYALMDGSRFLRPVDLEAAEAVWRYSERSVEHLFGVSTGNATADVIHRYLRQYVQMKKTDIHKLFNRNKEAHELDAALTILEQSGLAYRKYTVPAGGGRVETWYLQE